MLDHIYKGFYGEFPEVTSKTQEFIGAIDHQFKAVPAREYKLKISGIGSITSDYTYEDDLGYETDYGFVTETVKRMPTIKEMIGTSIPDGQNEPSDHFMQGAVLRFCK